MSFSPATVLARLIEDKESDIRQRRAPTLDLLASRGRIRTVDSTELRWNVLLGESTVLPVPMSTAGTGQSTGTTLQASLSLGEYKIYHQFAINRVDMTDAASRGTEALRRLFKVYVDAGVLALRKKINEYIWSGDGTAATAGIVGINKILDPTYNYAGINNNEWKPVLDTNNTPRPLTRTLLNNIETEMQMKEVGYDTIVMHPTTAQKYRELFESIADINQLANVAERQADIYSGRLSWMGTPILIDKSCPNTQITFFDSSYMELVSLDLSNSDRGQLSQYGMKDNFTTIDSAEVGGLRINVAMLPPNNPGTIDFQLFVIPQLRVSNRRMVQAIMNLSNGS